MATDMSLVTSVVDPEIAAAMQMFDRIAPLRNALGLQEDVTESELQLFAMVAHRTGLDPFSRQIYLIKRKGKAVAQTGIDGYRSTAERTGQYRGSDEATFVERCCDLEPLGHPKEARVGVRRADDGETWTQTGIARWHALYPGPGDDGFMWRRDPLRQLAKCAEADGLRKAFPRVLGGVYIAEEMEQAGPGDQPALVEAAGKPTARERLHARREAMATVTTDEPAVEEGTFTEPAAVPVAMTSETFATFLEEHRIAVADAKDEAARLFPGVDKLDDLQRAELAYNLSSS